MRHREIFFIKTFKKYQIFDITEQAKEIVRRSRVKNGEVKVRVYHTTTTLILNENEGGLFRDIRNMIEGITKMLKKSSPTMLFLGFNHDDIKKRRKKSPELPKNECKNALAHMLAILIGFYEISFDLIGGQIDLGTWQRILFIEFDEKPNSYKERKIGVRIISDQEKIEKKVCSCGGHR